MCDAGARRVFSGACASGGAGGGPWDGAGHLPADAPYPGWSWFLLWVWDNPVCGQAEVGKS